MTLEVVGAGFGRTGTLSVKAALEKLGFGPCYHMIEVFSRPAHAAVWHEAIRGEPVDFEGLFEGFRSTVDWPSCNWWRPLWEANPGAKVVLSRRDPEAWYRSISSTIIPSLDRPPLPDAPPEVEPMRDMARDLLASTFDGRLDDRDHLLAVLAAHEADVIAVVPADQLLVYNVIEGWGPLCAFLGVPVPGGPFPSVNTTAEFRERSGLDL